ncbi:MAG: hypothetical protein EOO73_31535 [Myxococcales bacterium]|nr:MAG: hypothetical protein EOO73_31535 [Myxococcales bacterium]
MLVKRKYQLACALTLSGVFAPTLAQAQTPVTDVCDTDVVTAGPRIYGSGGSAVTATLKTIQGAIANDPNLDPTKKLTIFYTDPVACVGWGDYLTGKSTRTFRYWVAGPVANGKPTVVEKLCLAKTGGQPLDFAHMGNAAAECVANPEVPEGIGDFAAPIQSTNVVTHPLSNETSISAEALYFIYGFGPSGQVAPWTDGAGVFARQSTSFVTLVLGYHVNLTPTQFQGPGKWAVNDEAAVRTNGDVITQIGTYVGTDEAKAAQSLGYISGSTADQRRSEIKTLAFQGFGAECGVYPDSTPTAFDKLNVRLGKYPLWAQGHYFTAVDASGKPTNEHVANLIGWADDSTKPAGTTVSAFDQIIKAGDVPACAMQALREDTAGAFFSYQPPKPCTGRYEFVATGATEHDSCEADSECSGESPFCNYGFCEPYRADGQEEG